jgi:hypothetical protein
LGTNICAGSRTESGIKTLGIPATGLSVQRNMDCYRRMKALKSFDTHAWYLFEIWYNILSIGQMLFNVDYHCFLAVLLY